MLPAQSPRKLTRPNPGGMARFSHSQIRNRPGRKDPQHDYDSDHVRTSPQLADFTFLPKHGNHDGVKEKDRERTISKESQAEKKSGTDPGKPLALRLVPPA